MIVLDASVAAAWFFEDERGEYALSAIERVTASGAIAPSFFPIEFANAFLVAKRRGRIAAEAMTAALEALARLPIALQSQAILVGEELELAERHGLSVYDSCYLTLAIRHRAVLLTLDDRLRAAALKENLSCE